MTDRNVTPLTPDEIAELRLAPGVVTRQRYLRLLDIAEDHARLVEHMREQTRRRKKAEAERDAFRSQRDVTQERIERLIEVHNGQMDRALADLADARKLLFDLHGRTSP